MSELLQTITVPRYITRIKVADKRRAKYYKAGNKIPKKYSNKDYKFVKGFLVDLNGDRVIANPRSVGKPRYEAISGNKLTSGYSSPFIRNKITISLHNFYRPFVRSMRVITKYPIRMEWDFYTTINQTNFDLSNFWFYLKYFEDTLVEEGIIPDDNVEFITHSASPKLIPVERFGQRKFVSRFYHDDREDFHRLAPWNLNQKPQNNE